MKHILRILGIVLLLSNGLFAQDKAINGKITDDKGEVLPGVSISVQGTTKGVTSDVNGKYSINAKSGNILVFTYVGMITQKVPVGNLSVVNVILKQDASELQEVEVVSTAFGLDKNKRTLGYATQTINGDEIAETGRENIFNALQSRVAGATVNSTSGAPGASSSLVLRGFNSLSGNNSPLIVIDGLPINNSTFNQGVTASGSSNRDNDFSNRLSDINPNDIESLTVLKGPEATALYGIDAGSGAIIIKTKKGQAGKPKISYNNLYRVDQTYLYPEKTQTVYGTGTLGSSATRSRLLLGAKIPDGTPIYDNLGNFFQDAVTQQHNLTINGGKDRFTYRLSGSSVNQKGTIPNTGYDRYNARATLSYYSLNKKLTLSGTGTYSYAYNQKALRGGGGAATTTAGGFLYNLLNWPVTDDARDYDKDDGSRRRFFDDDGFPEADNPYWTVNKNKSADYTHRRIYNLSADYKLTDWLNFSGRFSYDGYNTNGFTFYHPSSNDFFTAKGHYEEYTTDYKGLSGVVILGANKKITKKIEMGLRVGTAIDDAKFTFFSKRGQNLTRQVVGETDFIPDFRTIGAGTYLDSRTLGRDTLRIRRLQGVFGEYTFGYDKFLTLTVTGRNDWTSTLPADARSFFYPSASVAFVFTDLLPKSKILSFGKLRGSVAQTAKDIGAYQSQSIYAKVLTSGLGYGYGITNNNPRIVPERQNTFEVGTELQFLNKRISLDAAYYDTKNVGQIVSLVRLSYGTGFIVSTLNIADTRNQGIELMLNTQPIKTTKMSWNLGFNFSKTTNQVTGLPANVSEYYNSDTFVSGFRNGLVLGGETTSLTGQDYLRNNKGQILIDPGTGFPLVNSLYQKIGDRNPDFTLGITNRFTVNNFTLSFVLDTRKGGDIMNGTAYVRTLQGQTARTLNREQAQIVPGVLNDGLQDSNKPTANTIQIYPHYQSYYQDGRLYPVNFVERDVNWLRLRELSLRYNLPSRLVKSIGFENMGVFLTGTDLFILTNYSGADPTATNSNTASTGGTGGFGIDFFTPSIPRGFAAGVTIDFKAK
jgi:TonB-linked SusC/RagA family outer membrane protein